MKPITELILRAPNLLIASDEQYPCTIGRGGIAPHGEKREGDLKTPSGEFPLRLCYYRPDRVTPPETELELIALEADDGWCDDPSHSQYNTPVKVPFAAGHETLWRADHVYDLIIPLGYNDRPILPDLGSAIFLHIMRDDGVGTEGCIALRKEDLLALLPHLGPDTKLIVGK